MQNHQREGNIHISNLPNSIRSQHIVQYLETAGPIKQSKFQLAGQRLSATVVYYDYESAQMAKKHLDQKQFNTRKIKITLDQSGKDTRLEDQGLLKSKIASLKKQQKIRLLRYLKTLRDQEGQMFVDFLNAKPLLAEQLMKF